MMAENKPFAFGDYQLDAGQRKLSHNGETVAVEPKAFDLLVYLARNHHRAVDKDELQATLWPGVILTESALTRCVMKARRAVGDDRDTQSVIRTVHGHGYQFVAELQPTSVGATSVANNDISSRLKSLPQRNSGPRSWLVAAALGGLVVLAMVALLRLISSESPTAAPSDRSIAVLPFVDLSNTDENARFFADGVHDDLLTLLSKVGDLRVISRTSMEQYRGSEKTIPQIATELSVSAVVEGRVQRAGDRVRINAQLIDASNDQHLWAETFDRRLSAEDIFEIQREIAHAIADALHATLSPLEEQVLATTPTRNLEALYAYQRGRLAFDQTTGSSLQQAKAFFEEALQHDENFAAAMVGLAYTYIYLPTFGSFSSEQGYALAAELIAQAITIDPTLGEAYGARAILESRAGDVDRSTESLRKALSLAPNSSLLLVTYAMTLNRSGRGTEAIPAAQRAMRIDPVVPLPYLVYGDSLESVGRHEESLVQYARTIEIEPASPRGYASVGDQHIELGNLVEGVRWTRRALSRGPEEAWLYSRLGRVHTDLEDVARAAELTELSLQLSPGAGLSQMTAAYLALYQGDDAKAREYAGSLRGRLRDAGLNVTRIIDLRSNNIESVLSDYRHEYGDFFDAETPQVNPSNYRAAVNTADVMLRSGMDRQASTLLQAAWKATRALPLLGQYGRGIIDAEILALRGRPDDAINALQAAFDEGWRMHWWLHVGLNPNLDSLRGEPGFQTILAHIKGDMARQRVQIKALEDSGEIDPLPDLSIRLQ